MRRMQWNRATPSSQLLAKYTDAVQFLALHLLAAMHCMSFLMSTWQAAQEQDDSCAG